MKTHHAPNFRPQRPRPSNAEIEASYKRGVLAARKQTTIDVNNRERSDRMPQRSRQHIGRNSKTGY